MKPRNKKKSIYRSGLEEAFANNTAGAGFEFEPASLPYTMNRKYIPDFVKEDILIECKGFFRAGDTLKYKSIRESYPDKELVFILSDPYKKYVRAVSYLWVHGVTKKVLLSLELVNAKTLKNT